MTYTLYCNSKAYNTSHNNYIIRSVRMKANYDRVGSITHNDNTKLMTIYM